MLPKHVDTRKSDPQLGKWINLRIYQKMGLVFS